MTRLCFIDTETTSLRPDRRAWEIGIIAREPGCADVEHRWFIDDADLDLGNADLMSLQDRRVLRAAPAVPARTGRPTARRPRREGDALRNVEAITRGAHLVGAVVSFDADVLGDPDAG